MTRPGEWIVLRCAGRATLGLAGMLTGRGFKAWAPIETRIVTVPRMNAKREVRLPIMPGFVFAGAWHLWTLVEMAEDPRMGFSVFKDNDHYPAIPDSQLEPLRSEERRVLPRERARIYGKGEGVNIPAGLGGAARNFGGMTGVVLRGNARKTLVLISGAKRVEFFTFDLQPIQAISDDVAAKAA